MLIRDWWDKWVYAVAKPASVANREHTAEEVQNEVGAATFAGTSRGLGVGVCTGLVLGTCLPVVLWFLLHQPATAPKPDVNESELQQLRAENERLRSLSTASKPSVDENELKQMRAENETLRAENEKLKSQLAAAEKAKEEAKPVVAGTPKTKKSEQPKGSLQGTEPPNTYVCGDGRTVTNPAECRSKGG